MELESPADAWYVWLAVALASFAIAGVALSLPSGPPPDANAAANAIDRTAGNPYDAFATYDHDADEVRLDGKGISLRNEHGTAHASIAHGELVPATGDDDLEEVTRGTNPKAEFAELEAFVTALEASSDAAGEWRHTDGRLAVRTVRWEVTASDVAGFAGLSDPAALADRYRWIEYTPSDGTVHVTLVVA